MLTEHLRLTQGARSILATTFQALPRIERLLGVLSILISAVQTFLLAKGGESPMCAYQIRRSPDSRSVVFATRGAVGYRRGGRRPIAGATTLSLYRCATWVGRH
jgi:hypothetical protein